MEKSTFGFEGFFGRKRSEREKTMRTILIVDDQSGIRELLCEVFRKEGYDVYDTDNGEDALQLFDDKLPQLVLLDMKMPGMSGLDILKTIKIKQPNTSVVMMTAYAELDLIEQAFHLGALTCFKKPFDIHEIRTFVNETLHDLTI